jgi:hypothetical protein
VNPAALARRVRGVGRRSSVALKACGARPAGRCVSTGPRTEDQKALAITRFDRSWQLGERGQPWIARLPPEDFCQAPGYPPGKKYEKDGGPGIADCMRLLAGSADGTDRQTFALTQLAFWLMGATDGHAKNHSIFLQRGDTYITTPLYDALALDLSLRRRRRQPVSLAQGGACDGAEIKERALALPRHPGAALAWLGHEARRVRRVGGDA